MSIPNRNSIPLVVFTWALASTGCGLDDQVFELGPDPQSPVPETQSDSPGAPPTPQPGPVLPEAQCFYGRIPGGDRIPLSRIVHEFRATDRGDVLDVAVVLSRDFVDNTYGQGSIGWTEGRGRKKDHTFDDLVKSDHVELSLLDRASAVAFRARVDYVSASTTAPSGFAALGVTGGEGRVIVGSPDDVLEAGSSLSDNLNTLGYPFVVDSPATDASYAPNAAAPDWNYWVEYRLRLRATAFGPSGFGSGQMDSVHASPSKLLASTIQVEEGPCPGPGEGNPFPACARTRPDAPCFDPAAPTAPIPPMPGAPDPGASGQTPPGGACTSNGECTIGTLCQSGQCTIVL